MFLIEDQVFEKFFICNFYPAGGRGGPFSILINFPTTPAPSLAFLSISTLGTLEMQIESKMINPLREYCGSGGKPGRAKRRRQVMY